MFSGWPVALGPGETGHHGGLCVADQSCSPHGDQEKGEERERAGSHNTFPSRQHPR